MKHKVAELEGALLDAAVALRGSRGPRGPARIAALRSLGAARRYAALAARTIVQPAHA